MTKRDPLQFASELARLAYGLKSQDVVVLDLRGISSVTECVIVCSGTSERQMRTVADQIVTFGKERGERAYGVAGYDNATWILLDYVDVVFHIFSKTHREYYDLELLWGDAPRVEWTPGEPV